MTPQQLQNWTGYIELPTQHICVTIHVPPAVVTDITFEEGNG